MEKYGLTEKETELLKSAFEKFSQVETVFIYGSRAKNTFRKTSDIDLAVRFKNGGTVMTKLKSALDDLPIIYEIDLTDEAKIQSGDFKDEYERTKQIFYIKGWKTTTLGEVAVIKNGKSRPKNGKAYPVYGGNGILGYADEYNVDEEIIIIGRVGAYCGCIYFENNKFWLSDNALGVLANENSNIKFLHYLLKQLNLNKQAIGGAQPLLTQGLINQIEVIVPKSIAEQRAIAAVLSSLDDKIELLREQNKTLEATAQAIFKEWFVNFNFPGANGKMIDSELGKIPEGWEVDRLTDIFDFIKGIEPGSHNYSVKKLSEDYLPFYRVQDTLNYNETPNVFVDKRILNGKIFKKDDILISLDGTIGRIFIGGSGGYSSGIRKVVGKESFISKLLIYCFLKSDKFQGELNSFAGAETTIKHAGGAIEHIKFVFEKSICEEFGKITNPLFQKMVFNNSQIQTLSTLRDALLPKLMKGELRVRDFND